MNYNFEEWKVSVIHEPNELMKKLKELKLIGKKIKSIRCVGLCYNLTEDIIEDHAYGYYEKKGLENYEQLSNFDNIPLDTPFDRYVEIDEPIIIYFEDGDRLEVDYSEASYLKIGKNSLPIDIEYSTNCPNADMNIVFSNCIGSTITGFKVGMLDDIPSDNTGLRSDFKKQDSFISGFRIYLDNCIYLEFDSWHDYGIVAVGKGNSDTTILWNELKQGLKNN